MYMVASTITSDYLSEDWCVTVSRTGDGRETGVKTKPLMLCQGE